MKDLRLAGLHEGIVLQGPETVHIDITNSCNTNCVTCWDHSPHLRQAREAVWKRQRAEGDRIGRLLDDIQSLGGLRAIILSGMGEPFTHPGVYDIIADVKRRGLHLTIITNLLAADVERAHTLGVDTLLIGVQGASRQSYEAFHPSFVNDEWSRMLEKLEYLAARQRPDKHVQVICSVNCHELVEMVELAARYRASQLNFKLASLKDGTEAVSLSPEQRERLVTETVPSATGRAAELGVATNLEAFAKQLSAGGHKTAPIAEVGCYMGHYYSRVLVDGTVLYCCNVEVVVGRLHEQSFSALWNGPAWQGLRDRLRRGDYFPGCHQCGKFNQNLKIGRRFAKVYGESRRREITGL